mgnify:CR=1 FL=1
MLQQYLPLAVLKLEKLLILGGEYYERVATVLTACGIETPHFLSVRINLVLETLQQYLPLAVLKHSQLS